MPGLEDLDDEVVVAPCAGCRPATSDDRARLGLGDRKNLIDVAGLDGGDAVLAEDQAEEREQLAARDLTPLVRIVTWPPMRGSSV